MNEAERALKEHRRGPHVGDWADHKGGGLDPRIVTKVSKDGRTIWIRGFTSDIGPFEADHYWFKEGPS